MSQAGNCGNNPANASGQNSTGGAGAGWSRHRHKSARDYESEAGEKRTTRSAGDRACGALFVRVSEAVTEAESNLPFGIRIVQTEDAHEVAARQVAVRIAELGRVRDV
jgi:hypothetical protein